MVNFEQIKILIQAAGITILKVKFDGANQLVNISYVFKGKPVKKVITFQEIEIVLLGKPKVQDNSKQSPSMSVAQRAGCVLDVRQELK